MPSGGRGTPRSKVEMFEKNGRSGAGDSAALVVLQIEDRVAAMVGEIAAHQDADVVFLSVAMGGGTVLIGNLECR